MKLVLSALFCMFFSVSTQAQLFGSDGGFGFLFGEQPRYEVQRPRIIIRSKRKPSLPKTSSKLESMIGFGSGLFCVRTCDGFYFRVHANKVGGTEPQSRICRAMCPGAPTTLFTSRGGTDIERTVDANGQSYSKLPNALRFRKEVVSACSCQSQPGEGLADLPITQDLTLKKGDMVVSKTGVRVFKGSNSFPYRDNDFSKPQEVGKVD